MGSTYSNLYSTNNTNISNSINSSSYENYRKLIKWFIKHYAPSFVYLYYRDYPQLLEFLSEYVNALFLEFELI